MPAEPILVLERLTRILERLKRARTETVDSGAGEVRMRISTPEDTALHKLLWFRLGGEMSDRQWADVLGLLRVQGSAIDVAYLNRWAPVLGVDDLLTRVREEMSKGN